MILCLYFSCFIHVFPALSFLQIYNKKKPLSSALLKKQKKHSLQQGMLSII